MPQLTDQQIATVARQAGFTGESLKVAVAVALAESGGNSDARGNNSNGSVDSGLWQINSIHRALIAGRNVFDPAVNAQLAFQISGRGTNWRPWVAFNNGKHTPFLSRAAAAAGLPDAGVPAGGAGGAAGGSGASLDFFVNTSMWARVGVFILGSALLLFAIWKLAGSGIPIPGVGQALNTVKKVRKSIRKVT